MKLCDVAQTKIVQYVFCFSGLEVLTGCVL